MPRYEDNEKTFPELQARIAKTIDFIKASRPRRSTAAKTHIILKVGGEEMTFSGQEYLFGFGLPNFYFHVTTTYDILRHNGVEVGKMDYLGRS